VIENVNLPFLLVDIFQTFLNDKTQFDANTDIGGGKG